MHITLIGMSNIGKTHWSRLLESDGYTRVDCDDLVEKKLGPELQKLGYAGIRDVAKWMGQPYAPQYPETSRKFIECERKVMEEVVKELRVKSKETPLVIDTMGSVIYIGDNIAEQLRKFSRVIYLEASVEHRDKLFRNYIAEPKPVIWGDNAYAAREGERTEAALKRCYPQLLESRARRYEKMAQVTISFEQHHNSKTDLKSLKQIIIG